MQQSESHAVPQATPSFFGVPTVPNEHHTHERQPKLASILSIWADTYNLLLAPVHASTLTHWPGLYFSSAARRHCLGYECYPDPKRGWTSRYGSLLYSKYEKHISVRTWVDSICESISKPIHQESGPGNTEHPKIQVQLNQCSTNTTSPHIRALQAFLH